MCTYYTTLTYAAPTFARHIPPHIYSHTHSHTNMQRCMYTCSTSSLTHCSTAEGVGENPAFHLHRRINVKGSIPTHLLSSGGLGGGSYPLKRRQGTFPSILALLSAYTGGKRFLCLLFREDNSAYLERISKEKAGGFLFPDFSA